MDHEQDHEAEAGMEEVAPKRVEIGTLCLLRHVCMELTVGMCKSKTTVARVVSTNEIRTQQCRNKPQLVPTAMTRPVSR